MTPRPRTFLLALAGLALPLLAAPREDAPATATIPEPEVRAHLEAVAGPNLEGRDTPSDGQRRAAAYLCERFAAAGLAFAPDWKAVMSAAGGDGPDHDAEAGSYLRPFQREMYAPDPRGSSLALEIEGAPLRELTLGTDFTPIHRCAGSTAGELVYGGFALQDKGERYDDLKDVDVKGKVVLIFEGEPRHKKKFEGPEVTPAASLWQQLGVLERAGAAAALVVQRTPEGAEPDPANLLDFRYTWASWQGAENDRQPAKSLTALHVSMDCATLLLGEDARALAERADKSGKPQKVRLDGRRVRVGSATQRDRVRLDNVVGVLRGTDEALRDEYVVLGAHYDHIGVGPRGRIGYGADDNGSGVSALLEVLDALASAPPRRSVLVACFTAEEDGLFGSRELAQNLPVPKEQVVAMVNLDQVGIGETKETWALGTAHNPALVKVIERAERLGPTGLKKVNYGERRELGEDIQLFQRSDHHSFHAVGVPVLFFFEHLPLSDNKDYHTWRDTVDGVDVAKVTNTARLVYHCVWILANDDDRPPPPRD